jgi:putative addiction module killer protein
MMEIRQTLELERWLKRLRDRAARDKILIRIRRMALGNPGDAKSVGGGIGELRIDYGPGYRVYFTQRGSALIVLLCGGDKDTQERDIKRARELAARLEQHDHEN